MHPYVANQLARERHREMLAKARQQRLVRQVRDRARASRQQREHPVPGTPGHIARIIHGLALAIARPWRGGRADARPQRADALPQRADALPQRADARPQRADARPQLADLPAPVRQASRPRPDAVPRPRPAAAATGTASSVQPVAASVADPGRRRPANRASG
jgi:hypothetical protein